MSDALINDRIAALPSFRRSGSANCWWRERFRKGRGILGRTLGELWKRRVFHGDFNRKIKLQRRIRYSEVWEKYVEGDDVSSNGPATERRQNQKLKRKEKIKRQDFQNPLKR